MNRLINALNEWGEHFGNFAVPMLWQSSVLIALLFGADFVLRRKLRASVRYALWLVILVKLCVPPTFSLPTSPAWWLRKTETAVVIPAAFPTYRVTYDAGPLADVTTIPIRAF